MADELTFYDPSSSGGTLYAHAAVGKQVANVSTSAFETFSAASWANYAIALTERGTGSGLFTSDAPAGASGVVSAVVFRQAAGSPAPSDPVVGAGEIDLRAANLDRPVSDPVTLPSIPAGWITAAGIASDALDGKGDWNTVSPPTAASNAGAVWGAATRTLSGFGFDVTVGTNNDKAGYSLASAPPTLAQIVDGVWDEAQSGHTTAGTFGRYLDSQVSGVSGGVGGDATAAGQAAIITHLTDIKGASWAAGSDSLHAIRDQGDSAWRTATGFSTFDAGTPVILASSQPGYAPAKAGAAMTLTSDYDAARTAASAATAAAIKAATDRLQFDADNNVKSAAQTVKDGIISSTSFAVSTLSGVASGILEKIDAVWRVYYKPSVKDNSAKQIVYQNDAGSSPLATVPYTDDGNGNQTRGAAS